MDYDNEVIELFDEGEPSGTIVDYIIDKRDAWREDYETNYEETFEEYYRLWRAQWAQEDSERKSERSKLIAPALQQAVESSVAEVEEATFGRGKWFDLVDDHGDPDGQDVELLKNRLMDDFDKAKIRKDVSECLINAAVFGTGIGEVVMEEVMELTPASQPTMDGTMTAIGVTREPKLRVRLRPIMPKNFLIEPLSTSIDDSVGVIIDEFVPRHQVEELQDRGVYESTYIPDAAPDESLEPDEQLTYTNSEKIHLVKYYGLVPKEFLPLEEGEEDLYPNSRYCEGIVIIANDCYVLKANRSPYMMQDRPVVAFPWDIVPSRFWGRGVCEKGYMSQKALDTELRARIDALALVVHPMLAMDATRMPRGFKPEVRPGKVILTEGPPQEVLNPFKFGNLDPNTFSQAQNLQEMVQQATGAIDSTGLLSNVSGDAKAGAVSMSLGAVIKRHKRTLINFQDSFLIPFIKKAAYRYMQFDPENYPVKDWKFKATSTLGIIAREYEVSQLISLLQTMSPDSPMYPALIRGIVDNMNLNNREDLIKVLEEAGQPNPEAEKRAQEMHQVAVDKELAQIAALQGNARAEEAQAVKWLAEAKARPIETKASLIKSAMGDLQDDNEAADFDRRLAILDRYLKNRDLDIKEQQANNRATPLSSSPAIPGGQTPR